MSPLISIITPSLNRAHMIRQAIDSVLNQDYPKIEHIIMDGGSTDGTLELLKQYKHLRVFVAPDKNLYDAINKGISVSRGELIGHLNSDDFYEANCFKSIVQLFQESQTCDSVCGFASIFEETKNGFKNKQKLTHKKMMELNLETIAYGFPIINARFFRKSVYDKIGFYNIRYPLGADREFLLRANIAELNSIALPSMVYHYRQHENSLTINNNEIKGRVPELNLEYLSIIEHYLQKSDMPSRVYKICHHWRTWLIGYTFMQCIKNGYKKEALNLLKQGFSKDSLFLPRYCMQRLKQYWVNV